MPTSPDLRVLLSSEEEEHANALIREAMSFAIGMKEDGGFYDKPRLLLRPEEDVLKKYVIQERTRFRLAMQEVALKKIVNLFNAVANKAIAFRRICYNPPNNVAQPSPEEMQGAANELLRAVRHRRAHKLNGHVHGNTHDLLQLVRVPVLMDLETEIQDSLNAVTRQRIAAHRTRYRAAAEGLLRFNVRLVGSIAKKFFRHYHGQVPLADLLQEGGKGLWRSLETLDRYTVKFGTYATWWIRQHIRIAIVQQRPSPVTLGTGKVRALHRLRAEVAGWEHGEERELSPDERQLLASGRESLRFDDVIDDSGHTYQRFLEDPRPASADAAALRELPGALDEMLKKLRPREEAAVRMRYGLPHRESLLYFHQDKSGYSLKRIGGVLRVTRERARQIIGRAMEKLRQMKGAPSLMAFFNGHVRPDDF